MLPTLAQALFTALALAGIGFGIAKAVEVAGVRAVERRHGVDGITEKMARCARLEQKLEARRTERVVALKVADIEVRDVLARKSKMERELADIQRSGEVIVRQIGEEIKGSLEFTAEVINTYVGQQQQHAHIDPMWGRPQTIEVWSTNMHEARRELEKHYPPAFGYKITRLNQVLAAPPAPAPTPTASA